MANYLKGLIAYVSGHNQLKVQYGMNTEEMDNKHFVLWSGGCDSTLLLYELLDMYGCENVVAVSYKYPWLLDNKYQTEKLHREAFKAKLKLRGDKFSNINHTEFEINSNTVSGTPMHPLSGGNPQSVAWLLSVPLYTSSGAFVYTGTIVEDLPLALNEYYEVFSNISKLLDRDITLRLPYLHLTKPQIVEKLFQYDLYEESWFCEMPLGINKPCDGCEPCITHISALCALEFTAKDDLVKIRARKELDKIRKRIDDRTSKYVSGAPIGVDNLSSKSDKCNDGMVTLNIPNA